MKNKSTFGGVTFDSAMEQYEKLETLASKLSDGAMNGHTAQCELIVLGRTIKNGLLHVNREGRDAAWKLTQERLPGYSDREALKLAVAILKAAGCTVEGWED